MGDILENNGATFILIHGTISPGFSSDYLLSLNFWGKGCYDVITTGLGETPVLELMHENSQYAFGFDMHT